jgi:hypothetical protein
MTSITLAHPVGPISSVTVGIPPEHERDRPPPGVSSAIWNLSRAVGLTVEQTRWLHDDDIDNIAVEFLRVTAASNAGQAARRTGHRVR